MLAALFALGIAGGGAWLLAKWGLDELVKRAAPVNAVWPVAYYAYGALALLAIPSLGFSLVVGLKSFTATGPGGTSFGMTGDGGGDTPTVTTTTETKVK